MVALDVDATLLDTLKHRAGGLSVETVVADARHFDLRRRFPLVLVPMQTLQLLGGGSGRAAFLRRALDHLEPGGLLAAALADAMDCFDEVRDLPPPPDACELAGVRYASHLMKVVDEDGRAAIHRLREVIGPGERYDSVEAVVRLDRVTADEVAEEGAALGFVVEPHAFIPETEEYLGSTVGRYSALPAPVPARDVRRVETLTCVASRRASSRDRRRSRGTLFVLAVGVAANARPIEDVEQQDAQSSPDARGCAFESARAWSEEEDEDAGEHHAHRKDIPHAEQEAARVGLLRVCSAH